MVPPLDRSLFDLADAVWALHCAEGPVPRPAVEAARAHLEKELRPWELAHDQWLKPSEDVRRRAASLFGAARPEDFTLTSSTSGGLTWVAQSYPWAKGDEVLAPLGEFPSNVWPWKALAPRGVGLREVPLWDGHLSGKRALESAPPRAGLDPESRLLDAIGPRTRVLTASWVRFQDGLRLDLERLARGCAARGVDLVIDGIQGAGTLPLALEEARVAAFATGVHKGLLAPQGAGLLWTHPAFRERLWPLGSWLSVEEGGDFRRSATDYDRPWLGDGRKFEQGGMGGLLLIPLARALEVLHAAGTESIARHIDALQGSLLARLQGPEAERLEGLRRAGRLGSILSFHHGGRGVEALSAQMQEGLRRRIFSSVREGYLRVALHGWHDDTDVERLAHWLST
ncbi:MAG: aminotransferase class V-fold PLP-dependent enzyme [Deltaproteobacteria bacterium]|nr:aminotransferase class V-fold PLP-dependent enzyme [Deltaproteobacteria bacterium]